MAQSKPLSGKDLLLFAVLRNAGCDTNVRSFEALEVYQSKDTVKRQIYRVWPRDPDGKALTRENSCLGKMTSNGIEFWGATLWDFYCTRRIPKFPGYITFSTGSKLANWMIKHNETKHAENEIAWAQCSDAEPREIFPYPISEVIEAQEQSIRLGLCGTPWSIDKEKAHLVGIFSPDACPSPWPPVPFSYDAPMLQHRIPLRLLPINIIVHDPWDLLFKSWYRDKRYSSNTHDWTSVEDVTYAYHHILPEHGEERIKEEVKASAEERKNRRLQKLNDLHIKDPATIPEGFDCFLLLPSLVFLSAAHPPVLVVHEQAPDVKPPEEAHLYLSPCKIIGEGNHSILAHAELEVPRSFLVPPILCYECIQEDVRAQLSVYDPSKETLKGTWSEFNVAQPEVIITTNLQENMAQFTPPPSDVYRILPGSQMTARSYAGPARLVKTNVKWQNGETVPYCSHILKRMHVSDQGDTKSGPHPPTARVAVVAKLSKGDSHLDNERDNYERFPQHLSEHWNGYNLVHPMRNPTPATAVIPQYYGYYVVKRKNKQAREKTEDKKQDDGSKVKDPNSEEVMNADGGSKSQDEKKVKEEDTRHLSAIMFLENCGREVDIGNLTTDDRHECATLFHRLHDTGYLHQSAFPRNVVYQDAPLDRPKYQRGTGEFTEDMRKHCFRLIDFGRSRKCARPSERSAEEKEIAETYSKKGLPFWWDG